MKEALLKFRWYDVIAVALFLMLCAVAVAAAAESSPDQLIIKAPGGSGGITDLGFAVVRDRGMDRYVVELPPGVTVEAAMLALDPVVQWAEPDYLLELDAAPDDPLYAGQWHHGKIESEAAWTVTTGDPSVLIGVVDTGFDTHNADLDRAICGVDAFNPGASPFPCGWDTHGHGSHVAGIAAGEGDNGHAGAGLCWACSVGSYKFFNACGSGGLTSDAIAVIDRAVADGAAILNNSWGGGAFSQALLESILAACDAGVLFVTSAGNNGRDIDVTPHYPASYDAPCIIAVGNSTATDTLASSSNYGMSVHLLAPGTAISSLPGPPEGSQSQKPHTLTNAIRSGTSMAAPMVSGAAGLLKSIHPSWAWPELKAAILSSVDVVPGAALTASGGRLNVAAALGVEDPAVPFCGDGSCTAPEYCGSGKKIGSKRACSQDCPRVTGKRRACCGNGIPEPGELELCPENP